MWNACQKRKKCLDICQYIKNGQKGYLSATSYKLYCDCETMWNGPNLILLKNDALGINRARTKVWMTEKHDSTNKLLVLQCNLSSPITLHSTRSPTCVAALAAVVRQDWLMVWHSPGSLLWRSSSSRSKTHSRPVRSQTPGTLEQEGTLAS